MARPPVSNDVLAEALAGLKEDVNDIKGTMKLMTDAVSKLTAVEQRQSDQSERIGDAYKALAVMGDRVGVIEIAMPGLKELRRWVVAGMVAGVSMMFVSVISLVLRPSSGWPSTQAVIAQHDTSTPSIQITSPTGGVISGTVLLAARAEDAGGSISRVDFLVNGAIVNSDFSAPFEFALDTSRFPDATLQINAVVYDAGGNYARSAPVIARVDNHPNSEHPQVQ